MTAFQERLPNNMASLVRRIEALERTLQQAQAARRLEAATIGRGGITIKGGAIVLQDDSGNEIARMGIRSDLTPEPDGDPQPGFILRRNDGSIAFTLDDPSPSTDGYKQLLKMHDAGGRIIFMEDYITGWGLSYPSVSMALYPYGTSFSTWPGVKETSFNNVWSGSAPNFNPYLEVSVTAAMEGAGTGAIQLWVGGVQIGPDRAVTTQADYDWTVDLTTYDATPGTVFQVLVTAKGTGSVRCVVAPRHVYGRGSDVSG